MRLTAWRRAKTPGTTSKATSVGGIFWENANEQVHPPRKPETLQEASCRSAHRCPARDASNIAGRGEGKRTAPRKGEVRSTLLAASGLFRLVPHVLPGSMRSTQGQPARLGSWGIDSLFHQNARCLIQWNTSQNNGGVRNR